MTEVFENLQISMKIDFFLENCAKVCKISKILLANYVDLKKMLKNAPTLAIVAVHTAENEPPKVLKTPEKIMFKTVQRPSTRGSRT